MIQKNFDEITRADIDYLIENKIAEIKTLEYKAELPGPQDSSKKEFLADISSFANASGGDIIYGIKGAVDENGKKTGEPETVVSIQGVNPDEAKLHIENLIRTGIEPRIPVRIKVIDGYGTDGKGFILVIRIPQSFASPHMVILKSTSRFYARNSAGKYPLDVHEIRNAFLATDSQAERVRSFLQDRLAKIMADETPVRLSAKHRLILHVLPLYPFLNRQRLQLDSNSNLPIMFSPIGASGWDHRYNIDGFFTHNRVYENKMLNYGYCLVFFDGVIEAVYSDILKEKSENILPSQAFERTLVVSIIKYFKGYKSLGIIPPVIISVALLGCKGAYLGTDFTSGYDSHPIDRDAIVFPEVQMGSYDEEVPSVMKPIFDAVWNACGFERSFYFNENGNWILRL